MIILPGSPGKDLCDPQLGLTRREFARSCRVQSVRDGRCLDDEWVDYFWARLNRAGGHDASHRCLTVMTSAAENNGDPGRVRARGPVREFPLERVSALIKECLLG